MAARATIGDYVVTSKLGSGSFAVVYKGYHKVTKVPVAIKAMSLAKLNAKLLANLEMEIAIMRQIDHPNVVKLYEIKKTEKHMYLILEFCAGGDLQQFMRRRQQQQQSGPPIHPTAALPEDVARHFLRELAQGMKCLWTHNLIHRDLKPQNLLLTDDSSTASLKIADFGFARHLATASMAETLCGSPLYMAPEILKFQKYDAKADLWSVGTILFELLIGKPPYGGSNHVQLLANIERNDLKFPADVALSTECRALLTGLLHRRPVNRMGFDEFFRDPFVGLGGASCAAAQDFQTIRMTTSIREEEEDEDTTESEITATRTSGVAMAAERTKERSASESHMDGTAGQTSTAGASPLQASMRSSRSGNMEVMQTVFGSTNSGTAGGVAALRRSSRLGRSRRATSSGAINNISPKLSPQMSPNVLPSPGPRINPFKELPESPTATVPAHSDMRTSQAGGGMRSSQRAARTHATIVMQKNGGAGTSSHALDSSGEYVLVDSGSEKGGGAKTPSPSSSPPQASGLSAESHTVKISPRSSTPPAVTAMETLGTTRREASKPPPDSDMEFSHEYAQKLVEIVSLRIQAIAPIAEQLWKMSVFSSSSSSVTTSGTNLASVFSLSSSTSSSIGPDLAGSGGSDVTASEISGVIVEKKQYVLAAEALALYVKCMRMLQHALVYLRQEPARIARGSSSPTDKKAPLAWTETSRKVSMAFLVEQLNLFLDRADQCKRRMTAFIATSQASEELRSFVVSQDELLYSHAIRLGKEGAVKEVLGQSRSSYELYLQAMLLLETLLMEAPQGSKAGPSTALAVEDQNHVATFVKALDERLKTVKQTMEQQQQQYSSQRQSPLLLPRPMIPSSLGPAVTTSPLQS